MNKTLSLIIPVYNVVDYIERCIESLVQQTCTDFEIILVDDCGQDNSIQKALDILANSTIKYKVVYRKQNGGLSAARNSGIEHADNEYLFFVDSDDALPLDAIAKIKSKIAIDSSDIFYFNASYCDLRDKGFRNMLAIQTPMVIDAHNFLAELYRGSYLAYIWMYVFKKTVFNSIQFPNGAVYEDALTLPYMLKSVEKVSVDLSTEIYQYYVREGSISRSFHPQLKEVIPSFNVMEKKLYGNSQDALYSLFVYFRTTYLMRISRESFVRSTSLYEAIRIHTYWKNFVPLKNISVLWRSGHKRSAIFLLLLKTNPAFLSLLYKIKLLK